MRHQLSHFGFREIEGGHSVIGRSGPEKGCQLGVTARRQARHNGRAECAAIAVAAMTSGAVSLEQRASRRGILRRRGRNRYHTTQDSGSHDNLVLYTPASGKG
jgi:hypothetical protein